MFTAPDVRSQPTPELHASALVPTRCRVHKFGGSSLADPDRIRHVARLQAADSSDRVVLVVSAMQGVTDALIQLVETAAGRGDWREPLSAIVEWHREAAESLGLARDLLFWFDAQRLQLASLLDAISVVGAVGPELRNFVAGIGEVWSARLLAEFTGAHFLDARDVLIVAHSERGAVMDDSSSRTQLAQWLVGAAKNGGDPRRIVVTGYIARDLAGHATTLGRNGSDYSGALFASLFDADELQIWTDVDGVLSADPRRVPEAKLVDELSYEEACELAYFGAKVVHPQTMEPAIARSIPIRIRNTFAPDRPGTLISKQPSARSAVTGVTSIDGLALVDVIGTGLLGVPGTAERLFAALRSRAVSVVMISQGSSEHSICCAVPEAAADGALAALRDAFDLELRRQQIDSIAVRRGVSVLAAVGEGMAGKPGTAARLFDSLARAQVNVRAIAQGATERSITVAIAQEDATRALRAVHAAFYLSAQTVAVALIGPGQVGRALLRQIEAQRATLLAKNLDFRLIAIATSRRMQLSNVHLSHPGANEETPSDLDRLTAHLESLALPHAVVIDCSASDETAARYADWLARGIHVVTPNKHAGSGALERWAAIKAASSATGAHFRYEATVGAGLPVVQTARDLVDTGDEILAIEGMLSGTLAWLFADFDATQSFAARVREARAAGYTEPDPREDLSGRDVARKLVILAREIGWALDSADVEVESLVPRDLERHAVDGFLDMLDSMDEPMRARAAAATVQGKVLRYVARLDVEQRTASVRLVELDASHPFAHARGTDNAVRFVTARYRERPLVVQGPGAGPEVTAAGVFSDLLRVAATLGAPV